MVDFATQTGYTYDNYVLDLVARGTRRNGIRIRQRIGRWLSDVAERPWC